MASSKVLDHDVTLVWAKGLTGQARSLRQGNISKGQPLDQFKFRDVYSLDKFLGSGAFGKCFLGRHAATGQQCVVKTVCTIENHSSAYWYYNNFVTEDVFTTLLKMSTSIPHPNIVKYLDFVLTPSTVCVVMSPLTGDELCDVIVKCAPLTEEFCRRILTDVFSALQHVHQIGIIHRDVKLDSLRFQTLSSDAPLVLFDFGLCCHVPEKPTVCCNFLMPEANLETVGTLAYMAPEVWSGKYGTRVDVWSVGVILYMMLVGSLPFDAELQNLAIAQELLDRALNDDSLLKRPPEVIHLLEGCLALNPRERFSAIGARRHPWFSLGSDDGKEAALEIGACAAKLERACAESRASKFITSRSRA